MGNSLRRLFDHAVSRRGAAIMATASLAFFTASWGAYHAPLQPSPDENTPHPVSYWQLPGYDVVIRLQPCEEKGLCASVYDINPDDPATQEGVAQMIGLYTRSGNRTRVPDTDRLSRDDMLSYCGYMAELDIRQTRSDRWEGRVYVPSRDRSFGVIIRDRGDGRLAVTGFLPRFPLIRMTRTVDAAVSVPSQPCVAPKPPVFKEHDLSPPPPSVS